MFLSLHNNKRGIDKEEDLNEFQAHPVNTDWKKMRFVWEVLILNGTWPDKLGVHL